MLSTRIVSKASSLSVAPVNVQGISTPPGGTEMIPRHFGHLKCILLKAKPSNPTSQSGSDLHSGHLGRFLSIHRFAVPPKIPVGRWKSMKWNFGLIFVFKDKRIADRTRLDSERLLFR